MDISLSGPMVSVIIPAYQAQDFVENCVRSVCAQIIPAELCEKFGCDDRLMEIIIIDDGSTDRTGEICDGLSDEFSFVKVLHVKNGGVSKARNLGIENSCGRYIAFVDADDLVTENYIADLLAAALENDAGLVIMDGKIVTDDIITGRRYIEDGILCEDTHVWGKLFSRELMASDGGFIRFPEGLTIGEDMLFLLEILIRTAHKPCIKAITGNGYRYNFNDSGAMLKAFSPSYLDQISCWERAGEMMDSLKPGISETAQVRLSVIKIMAALLVVSKFAKIMNMSENKDRTMSLAMKDEVMTRAKGMIDTARKTKGAYGSLSAGYKIKTAIFCLSPELYLKLYGQWKKR